jgi:hypothetical protein
MSTVTTSPTNIVSTTELSGGNTFNPSSLVSKTVMGLLEAKPTLAKFANSTHNRVFSEKNKPYAPGTTYTINIPTYPQIQYGASVNPSAKNIRYTTININTGSERETSGYINAVRVVDQVSRQLYVQDPDEWSRQFIKPTFEVIHGTINTFLQRQLGNSAAYTVLPRFANDRGFANEACGRFLAGDISMFTRALDYMCAFNMHNYMDFVFCMNSSAYYTMLNNIGGQLPAALPTGIPTRFLNQYNEKAVKEGILDKTFGLYIYHTPYIPYHYSGTMSYTDTSNSLPDLGTNFIFNKTLPEGVNLLPEDFYCAGYNESTAMPAPTEAVVSTITTIPETKGWLIVAVVNNATAKTNTLKFQFNPRDTLVFSPLDDTTTTLHKIRAVDPINKDLRAESFTCNVACTAPFTVTITNLAASTGAKFYIPVNFLPIGPDPINTSVTPNQYNELQTVGLWNNPKTSIYNAVESNGDVLLKTIDGVNDVALRHIGNHTKIYGFSTNGLHFVNPPLADIVGADNEQVYDDKSRMSILTTIQGGVTAGTNIIRTSTLWGSGGITDAIVQIPYYPGF